MFAPCLTRASDLLLTPPGASGRLLLQGTLPSATPERAGLTPWRGSEAGGAEGALLTLPPCIQEAEQTFLSELAALARVPPAESRPVSNKRGLSGKRGRGGLQRGLCRGLCLPVPWPRLTSRAALGFCVLVCS